MTERRGFTMITTLWVLSVASVVAAAAALAGRITVDSTRNRTEMDRAWWRASGCAARAHAAIDSALGRAAGDDGAAIVWRTLDRRVGGDQLGDRACSASLVAAGTRLDVNGASDEMVSRLLSALDVPGDQAESMVDALDDWKDSDDVARPAGAERPWYEQAERPVPRNGALQDIDELALVRGFETLAVGAAFTTESGRVSLATAPVPVLVAVPGVTRETADTIVARRAAGAPIGDLLAVVSVVSRESADSLTARYADAVHVSTPTPDAWILMVRSTSGFPANHASIAMRLVRDGGLARVEWVRSEP